MHISKQKTSLTVSVAFTMILGLTACEPFETKQVDESSEVLPGTEEAAPSAADSPNVPTAAADDFDLSRVSWIGPDFSNAVLDERAVLHSVNIDLSRNLLFLQWDPLPRDWPLQVNAPGMLNLFEQRSDGSWRGGKFEWLDPGQTAKTLKNIDNGYNGWRRPARGSRVAIIIFSTDGRRRSNVAYTTYD